MTQYRKPTAADIGKMVEFSDDGKLWISDTLTAIHHYGELYQLKQRRNALLISRGSRQALNYFPNSTRFPLDCVLTESKIVRYCTYTTETTG